MKENQHEHGRKFIVTETVFSMDGDIAPVEDIVVLAERYGAGVIVDEAHATAMHGPGGRGIAATLLAVRENCCGHAYLRQSPGQRRSICLRQRGLAGTFDQSRAHIYFQHGDAAVYGDADSRGTATGEEMDSERAELSSRAREFAKALRHDGWETMGSATQIVPAVIGENSAALSAAEYLQREGFAVRAIRPPTVPPGTARLRFSLTHKISAKELEQLAAALGAWRSRQQQPTHLAMAGNA